jgi:hypothetical protein
MDSENYQPDGDGYALHDVPHVEIMFDALNDTAEQVVSPDLNAAVHGTESLRLTPAMHYAQGVLLSAGIVNYSQVTGNEGIFSAIGDAFKATYDYIVKTFKAIWDFFFNRDSKKEAADAQKAVDENNAELSAAANGSQTEEAANAQISAMASVANGEGGDKAIHDTLVEAKKGDLKEKRKAIHEALKAMPKMNRQAKLKFEQSVQTAVKVKQAFMKMFDGDVKAVPAFEHLASKDHPVLTVMTDIFAEGSRFGIKDASFAKTQLENASSISSIDKAIALGRACSENIKLVKSFSDTMNGFKGKIETVLKQTEERMKKAKDGKDKEALSKDITALRGLVVFGTRLSKLIESNYHKVKQVSEDVNKMFCL